MNVDTFVGFILSSAVLGSVATVFVAIKRSRRGSPEQRTAGAAAFEADTDRIDKLWKRIDDQDAKLQGQAMEIRQLWGHVGSLEHQVIGLGGTPLSRPPIPSV